jgi:hypothetical protein
MFIILKYLTLQQQCEISLLVWLYGCATWKNTEPIIRQLQVFTNKCLWWILEMRRPEVISNEVLWKMPNQQSIRQQIKEMKWWWTEDTLRKLNRVTEKSALHCIPQGERRHVHCKRGSQWRWKDLEWTKEAGQQQKGMKTLYFCPIPYNKKQQ